METPMWSTLPTQKWMTKFSEEGMKHHPSEDRLDNLYNEKPLSNIL